MGEAALLREAADALDEQATWHKRQSAWHRREARRLREKQSTFEDRLRQLGISVERRDR